MLMIAAHIGTVMLRASAGKGQPRARPERWMGEERRGAHNSLIFLKTLATFLHAFLIRLCILDPVGPVAFLGLSLSLGLSPHSASSCSSSSSSSPPESVSGESDGREALMLLGLLGNEWKLDVPFLTGGTAG